MFEVERSQEQDKKLLAKENHDLLEANQKLLILNFCTMTKTMYFFPNHAIIIIIIIINDTLARSLEPVVTECKEHTIRTQTKTNG